MRLFSKKTDDAAIRKVAEQYQEALQALVDALLAGEADIDIRLAEMLEDEPELVRVAIVEKMREMIRARDAEKAQVIDKIVAQQKLLERQSKHRFMQEWLAYFLSQETLRKIREAFMASPSMQREVENVGVELAKKGLLQNIQPATPQELGSLSANVQHGKGQGRDQGKGL